MVNRREPGLIIITNEQLDMLGVLATMFVALHEKLHRPSQTCDRCRLANELLEIAAMEAARRNVDAREYSLPEDSRLGSMLTLGNLLGAAEGLRRKEEKREGE